MIANNTVFSSAITDEVGNVNAGYLALYFAMAIIIGFVIPMMVVGAFAQMAYTPDHKFAVQDLGIGIGAAATGFSLVIGAIAGFLMGDKPTATKTTP